MDPQTPLNADDLARQVELAKKDLERLEQLKPLAHLASTMVHDIRNSLGIIASTAQFVLTNLKPVDREKQAWEMVVRNVESIKSNLKSYLGFAKQFETNRESVLPNDIVARVCHYIESPAKKQNTRIEKNLDGGKTYLMLDVAAIESAVLNIALNALESVEHDGSVVFETQVDENEKQFLIRITDTGPGISEETRQKLFQPFFTTKKNGTGMGLYSAKVALENHGGKISCESQTGRGTRMTFALPLREQRS